LGQAGAVRKRRAADAVDAAGNHIASSQAIGTLDKRGFTFIE
jgi:hypothetical protein